MGVETTIWSDTRGTDSNAGPSGRIWKTWYNRYQQDPTLGILFKPDLYNCPAFTSAAGNVNGIMSYQDTGVTISGDPTIRGALKWNAMDADNDCGVLTGAGNTGTTFLMDSTAPRRLKYEIGLKKEAVSNNSTAFFAGLTEEGMAAATNTLLSTDDAALADKDLIGFHVTQAAGATVTFVYNKAGAGGVTVKIAALQTMAADTWYKFGFDYNPFAPAAQRITVFVNGVPNATYVTAAQCAAALFPDGEELVPTIAVKKGEATEKDFWVRLWMVAQDLSL